MHVKKSKRLGASSMRLYKHCKNASKASWIVEEMDGRFSGGMEVEVKEEKNGRKEEQSYSAEHSFPREFNVDGIRNIWQSTAMKSGKILSNSILTESRRKWK